MNRSRILKGVMISLVLMIIIGGTFATASAATVSTDKGDYAPGEVVIITGSGWTVGETVMMVLHEEPQLDPDVTLTSIADEEGNIINAIWSPDGNDIGLTFTLTATGQTSNLTAQTTFTDSPKVDSVIVSAQSQSQLCAGSSATYEVTVYRGSGNGSTGSFNADLTITSSLPDGIIATFSAGNLAACTTSSQNTCFDSTTATIRFGTNDDVLTVALTLSNTANFGGSTSFTVQAFKSTGDYATGDGTLTVIGNGESCSDGNACTLSDTCQNGSCQSGTAVVCSASDQCHVAGTCDTATGSCSNPTAPNDTPCSDGNACTLSDTCQNGSCQSGTAVVCSASDQCHVAGTCDTATGSCSNPTAPNGTTCDDQTYCTVSDQCTDGVCGGSPRDCNDNLSCTADSCNETAQQCDHIINVGTCLISGTCYNESDINPDNPCQDCDTSISQTEFSLTRCSLVTDSALCTFAVDSVDGQFRLIFTPDFSASSFKLNASNPGQFYYNIVYLGDGDENISIDLPYPFVTQGAVPIHIYTGLTFANYNESLCFDPATEIANSSTQVTLDSYGSSDTKTVVVSLPPLPGGMAYINIHLDYGLKITTGYAPDGSSNATQIVNTVPQIMIPNPSIYNFSDSSGYGDQVQSENVFKKDPGIGGLVQEELSGDPVPNVTVQIYDASAKKTWTVYTDEDGWYMWQYKYTGKPANFTITLPDYNEQQTVRLKANGFLNVPFTVTVP
jgi:hypothetical protein